ncbi:MULTISPECIES: PAM68 family protein [unclassified Coleofasciculus]|uniref:PAM68 family protein n=1 Tax=unclassified Coleofasciculus TaxID=2692782 RepID=UPI0018821839|nr:MULTISPECIES: PAM68 family protein [unclassified Coleofasciculus]MBE9125258.1 PAM68 family protein [Coleofasciculus sp. LEGE 07081]MBE9148389.1 PAM68 family protein [Coleofasciculus sp. LEGE 07092]
MSTESPRNRLPFEPRSKRKKTEKTKPEPIPSKTTAKDDNPTTPSRESMTIPDAVSKRMVRRMALLCGIPTALAISSFFISYFLVTNVGLKLPNVAVVLVSMGFFGLGVLGLSYGVLSASWDEESPGTVLGWQEFTTNVGRMTAAWRSVRQKN